MLFPSILTSTETVSEELCLHWTHFDTLSLKILYKKKMRRWFGCVLDGLTWPWSLWLTFSIFACAKIILTCSMKLHCYQKKSCIEPFMIIFFFHPRWLQSDLFQTVYLVAFSEFSILINTDKPNKLNMSTFRFWLAQSIQSDKGIKHC